MFGFKIISKEELNTKNKLIDVYERMCMLNNEIINEYKARMRENALFYSKLEAENTRLKLYIEENIDGSHGDRERTAAVNDRKVNQSCNCEENSEASQNESDI